MCKVKIGLQGMMHVLGLSKDLLCSFSIYHYDFYVMIGEGGEVETKEWEARRRNGRNECGFSLFGFTSFKRQKGIMGILRKMGRK